MKCFHNAFSAMSAAFLRIVLITFSGNPENSDMVSFYNIRYFRIVVIRAMDNFHTIFQLTVSTFNEFTHKPNPAKSVVIVGTWNATLSNGVYPQGS